MRLDRESIGVEANDAGTTRTTGTTGTTGTTVVWFRRDLRLHDHPALTDALANGGRIAPLFVVDERLVSGRWPAPNRVAFMLRSVAALRDALEAHGGRLFVRVGRPDDVVPAFVAEVRANRVLASRDYGPYARRRDRDVDAALGGVGAALRLRRGVLVHEPEELLTAAGAPFRVFSPFRRAWDARPRRQVLPLPEGLDRCVSGIDVGTIPSLASLGIGEPSPSLPQAGEASARARLERWVGDGLERYAERRDRLDLDGTSRLSQDLHWGLLSPLEVVDACAGPGGSRERFVSELTWRDFYHAVLATNPHVTERSYAEAHDALPVREDAAALEAWQEGRTGYPVVDAAMRQLRALGWMHNRGRMIAASFLTKDLLIDRRLGERHFMQHLTDGSVASNNGGWQWAAGSGTDAQPFVRVFNPALQSKRFDPDGAFARRWLPELAGVPAAYIHEPWTMPPDVQEAAGCVIGRDYPAPIVDHAEARRRAIAAYSLVDDRARAARA